MNKKRAVLIFAGTTEGKQFAFYLAKHHIRVEVCVATEYGGIIIENNNYIQVHCGRLQSEEIEMLLEETEFDFVVDATHPYATIITKEIKKACSRKQIIYKRLLRESSKETKQIVVSSIQEAVNYLKKKEGIIFATTGSKELATYTQIPNYETRVYARMLPLEENLNNSIELGFQRKNIICMQGPFSVELNYGMLKQIKAKYLVTKESGNIGGMEEKLEAARLAGVTVVQIARPEKENGLFYSQLISFCNKTYEIIPNRCITIIGVGPGGEQTVTKEAKEAIKMADFCIGSNRLLNRFSFISGIKWNEYKAPEIIALLKEKIQYTNIVVLYSGDIGFYSGAKQLRFLAEQEQFEVKSICGIPSFVYFCAKLNLCWEQMTLLSMHGRDCNFISAIQSNLYTFLLLNDTKSLQQICRDCIMYGLEQVTIYIGESLSYPEEMIQKGTPKQLLKTEINNLSAIIVENPFFQKKIPIGIEDSFWIRGNIPMTKSEIRAVCLSKLNLLQDSIIYDIGAGTGSVSIEMAMQAKQGMVYAIEKKREGIELIEQNKRKFRVSNIITIEGEAVDKMEQLPIPTHAFLGGTSGTLKKCLQILLTKNPTITIVLTSITLETITEWIQCSAQLPLQLLDITQMFIAKSKEYGNSHLMFGQNPIYIITAKGIDKKEDNL